MPYQLRFAGVYLPLSTPQLERHLDYIHSPFTFADWDAWPFEGFGLEQLPTPSLPQATPLQIGVLHWPTGASRPAWMHIVVNGSRLEEIRSAVSDPMTPQSLILADQRAGHSITASMYLLPPRPLNQLGVAATDGWLITLTDRRFYDHWKRGTISAPVSWTHLFSQISTILGTTISVDSVPSAYGSPSSKWTQYYQPTATILDAAAAQVGQVVVYGLDGTISTKNWSTAKSASDAALTGLVAQSGGFLADEDLRRYVPASVNVCFATQTNPVLPYVVNKTLASLAISEYGASTGVANTQGTTFADTPFTGTNTTAVNDYATQAATDWYGWRLPDVDVSIPGIQNWTPTGWEDVVEWTYQRREGQPYADTRIRRGPWDEFPSGSWYAGLVPIPSGWIPGGSGSGSGSGSGCAAAVDPIEITCENGVRTAIVKSIAVGIEDNTLVLVECAEESVNLGPCSPTDPQGTKVPTVTKVCPVYETIQYLDWDSLPQSKRVVTGIVVERTLTTVPIADPVGCIEFTEFDCCSGSGSGSGGGCVEECFTECDRCVAGMSSSWTLTAVGYDPIQLCRVTEPSDGNYCRFVSEGGEWELYYDYALGFWVLENYDTGALWGISGTDWSCISDNILLSSDGDPTQSATVEPDLPCASGAPCLDGTDYKVATVSLKTDDCTCLPDTLIDQGSPGPTVIRQWGTNTCPGNLTYELRCEGGQYVLEVISKGYATLVSYVVGTIVFQLPDLGFSCGGSGGSARVTITA